MDDMVKDVKRPKEPFYLLSASSQPCRQFTAATNKSMNAVRVFTKGWSLEEILSRGTNFLPVPVEDVEHQSAEQIDLRVRDTEADGIPLVMQNWHKRPGWNAEIFSPTWLTQNEGDASLSVPCVSPLETKQFFRA